MNWFWIMLAVSSVILNVVMTYYLYKFIRIIMLFEDDINDVIKSLEEVEAGINNVLELKMFFDDMEIKKIVASVMDILRMARFNVNRMAKRFTEKSKQKYILIQQEPDEDLLDEEEEVEIMAQSKGRRTLLHVGKNV